MGRFPRSVFGALLFCLVASLAAAAPQDPSVTAAAFTKSGFAAY